jgi:competence protein ComEA
MVCKTLFSPILILLLASNLALTQHPGQRAPTTPPTFPQKKSAEKSDLVDINSATKERLMALPGIDDALAEKIISNRPYKKKSDLKKKKVVSDAVYKQIDDKIKADVGK